MRKSSRHAKITGDFAEGLVLYWLSKYGYECARVDHTGIDLIARQPDGPEVLGISVKSRSRYAGTEGVSVNLPSDGFDKARRACAAFGCVPYYAIVVDGAETIRCFLVSLAYLEQIASGSAGGTRYWQMGEQCLAAYRADPLVRGFELRTSACSWRDKLASGGTSADCGPTSGFRGVKACQGRGGWASALRAGGVLMEESSNKPAHLIPSVLVGVAGEYFVAAELSRRGHIASISLRNTRGIDILVTNAQASRTVTIQCKTSQRGKKVWVLDEKCEEYHSPTHFYVFVILGSTDCRPSFHVVPSEAVAQIVAEDHRKFLSTPGRNGRPHVDNPVRQFRDLGNQYLERWDLLGL